MSNEIQRFDFKGESLRALTNMAGEPWFVLKDCMSILDLGNPTETVKMFDDDEFSTTEVIDSIGRRQQAYIISEPGLYRLVMRSRKPEAKEFQRWVTHEVLPSIRKHGAYMTQQTLDKALTSPDFLIQLATKLKEEQEKVKELEPKAQALDDFTNVEDRLLVRDAAKVLSNAGTPIKEKQLREWMADHNWIFKSGGSWRATAEHCAAGHLVMVMSQKHGVKDDGTEFAFPPTVRITRKGLALLHKRLGEIALDKALDAEVAA
ncbi:BRO family protein [Bifidobacterium adolescentis]|uniref:BRO family protein n=1 Tax=Bifidobacterium adolescentis TaxID=1680 RepID=UPI003B99636C